MSVRPLNRVDLYRIVRAHPGDDAIGLALFFDYDWEQLAYQPELGQRQDGSGQDVIVDYLETPAPPAPEFEQRAIVELPFFIPSRLTFRDPEAQDQTPKDLPPPPADAWTRRPIEPPPHIALRPQVSLGALLRGIVERGLGTGGLDIGRAVGRLAKGETLAHFPRKMRRQQAGKILLLLDRSRHLAPYWVDQEQVAAALRRCAPDAHITIRSRNALFEDPANFDLLDDFVETDICLALSDFGALGDDERLVKQWTIIARHFAQGHAFGLTMAPFERIAPDIRRHWQLIGWEEAPSDPAASAEDMASAEQILALLSPAFYLTPAMVRGVRRHFCPEAPAHVEALVWQHPWLENADPVSACFTVQDGDRLRSQFALIDDDSARTALAIIRKDRFAREGISLGHDFWFPEILNLCPRHQSVIEHASDLDEARDYFAHLAATAAVPGQTTLTTLAYLSRCGTRASQALSNDSGFRNAVWVAKENDPDFHPSVDDPARLPSLGRDIGAIHLRQAGDRLILDRAPGAHQSPLGTIMSANGLVSLMAVEADDVTGSGDDASTQPPWAQRFGEDQYGYWAEIDIKGVTQRLRWIPPGRFLMGSPEDEEGRFDDEGPQTEIRFTEGYWMFDTAVTQRLWRAVMNENPNPFKGSNRPVVEVSWLYADVFVARVNAALPGLELCLPSEAQWEYACRAGRITPYYFGDEAKPEQVHCIGDTTISVTAKPPNGWGLYQMHGNVWEWCADHWHGSHVDAAIDGATRQSYSLGDDHARVVRGGSWGGGARRVRAACRDRHRPIYSGSDIGFRCVAGQAGPEAPTTKPQQGGEAAAPIATTRIMAEQPQTALSLRQEMFTIRTDRADLTVARITKADLGWASGLGRDRFGLWADLTVDDVTQRLRCIPPGRFLMGSPEDEPGRYGDEGPQTEVTIGQGYWLFDAPVTQGLWSGVMGENPSRFVSAERPVERVSWDNAQSFVARMNDRFAGLGLHLPSEAQWEYACRGGTSDATYAGPIEIVGAHNAPVLDAIAWYGGNSGVNFDLAKGYNSSDWPETQYTHDKAGTREVKQKRANAFGLYDMLGNVWEWCADIWHSSHEGADAKGSPRRSDSQPAKQGRVVRGGSWHDVARRVRAAARHEVDPGGVGSDLGFRCAAGQLGPEAQHMAFGPDGHEAEPRLANPNASARKRTQKRTP